MRIIAIDASAGHHIDQFGSDFVLTPLMNADEAARTIVMHLPPGGGVGEHEAGTDQLFCVMTGTGWVSGSDGVRVDIGAQQAAYWTSGELHAAGTDTGLTAVVIEGHFTLQA